MTDAALLPELGSPVPSRLFRPLGAHLVQAITHRVRTEVPDLGHCPLLEVAARSGVRTFLHWDPTDDSELRKLDELFRRLGHGFGREGRERGPMVAALNAASHCTWDEITDFAVERQFSAAILRDVGSALLGYSAHLREQLVAGYDLAQRYSDRDRDRTAARTRLLDLLSNSTDGRISPLRSLGMNAAELRRLASAAEWPVPDRVVALAASFHGDPPNLPDRAEILTRLEADRLVALCPDEDAEDLAALLIRSGSDRRVALSWPVRPDEAGSALIWTARALDLVGLGVLPPTTLVRCADHVTQLWLHAEPSMRQRLCQELLEPLLGETPNSREILSDTLLAWLETRDSAPAIAARLDVHPQTVRYRWKRINELFGDALHDPEFILQMTMVLKTSLLMWKAGNQSDFERFRDRKMSDS